MPRWTKDRFWAQVEKNPVGCWIWRGPLMAKGYGLTTYQGVTWRAHRLAYALHWGVPPVDKVVMHICDVRACVRPDHLRLGTVAENNADMLAKGRHRSFNTLKTHCHRGHPFDAENAQINRLGQRQCRACRRIRQAAFREARA